LSITPFPKVLEVLFVEDSWGDVFLMREAFRDSRFPVNLNIVTDGEEALAFLKRENKHMEAPEPDLVLLDLNLPRMDGRVLLRRIKAHPRFKLLPVVVLTSSKLDTDMREVLGMEVDQYLVKPADLQGFRATTRQLWDFWQNSKAPLSQTD
jgi:two-component system, chemotaxis family, response regulator Rcp1